MKNLTMVLAIVAMSILLVGSTYAQVTQNLTLAVGTVTKIDKSGDPAPLTISTGVAGTDALTAVSDASTSYSITQNVGNMKITAGLDAPLPAGYTLTINLASAKGTSAGAVDISDGTSPSVVTAIAKGADAAKSITYSFSALASAGTLASAVHVVTLTLTN